MSEVLPRVKGAEMTDANAENQESLEKNCFSAFGILDENIKTEFRLWMHADNLFLYTHTQPHVRYSWGLSWFKEEN